MPSASGSYGRLATESHKRIINLMQAAIQVAYINTFHGMFVEARR